MQNYWPPKVKNSSSSIFLWDHEWTDHGKDYAHIIYMLRPSDFPGTTEQRNAALQLAYFKDTINLYKSLNVQKLKKSNYSKAEYATHLGISEKNLIQVCFKGSQIREILICYDITKSGMKLKSCTKSTSTCSNGGALVDLFEWSQKGQSRVFNYPKYE